MHTLLASWSPDTTIQLSLVGRLLIAAILGSMLGLERTLAGKHAGMRTYALVSMGSSLFVIAGTLASFELSMFSAVNPLVVAANVVLGVGFLGTGLAMFKGEHPVELTTAAGLWLAAGVGMAAGFGLYTLSIGSTIIGMLIFSLILKFENRMRRRFGTNGE